MADTNKVIIEISATGNGAAAQIDKITNAVTNLADKGGSSLNRFSNIFDIFAGNLAANAVGKGFGIATEAAGKFFETLIVDGVRAAQETQDNITRLNQALAASGKYTEAASESLVEYSEQLQRTTKFSNDQVLRTEALISTFGRLGANELKVATKAALDLATAYGIDLESASRLVGKAAEGDANAFAKLRIRFVEGATSAQTFANAMEAVNSRVGGAAEAQVNTFSGAVAVAGHAFEDMTKEIGNVIISNPALINVLKQSALAFDAVGKAIQANSGEMQQWITGSVLVAVESIASLVRALAAVESVVAGDFGKKFIGPISKELDNLSNSTARFYAESIAGVGKVAPAVKNVVNGYQELSKAQSKLIEEGIKLAEKSDPTKRFIGEVEALRAALDAKKILEEDYTAAVVSLQQVRDEAIHKSVQLEVEAAIEKNRAILAAGTFSNDEALLSNLSYLNQLAANEKLSAKDRAKIQREITETEKKQNDERLQAGVSALSALASFQQFKSKELQAVGKAAAIANTTIATYEGATKANAALAGIPIVGPILGAAAAAAFIAAGLANVAKISGVDLATGLERVPSGYPNDTFRANLSTDEGVLNRRDNRVLTLLARQDQSQAVNLAILERLDRLENKTVVMIGQKVIVDELRDAYESGRIINV